MSLVRYMAWCNVRAIRGEVARTFTIENAGPVNLHLTFISISTSEFRITTQPSSPLPSSGSTTFVVTFRPIGTGRREGRVVIENDDPNENPYTFAIQGTGTANASPLLRIGCRKNTA